MTLAAAELGWEVVGIRDGFAGLLEPGDYPDGGLLPLSSQLAESLNPAYSASVLGQSPRDDPFHMRQVDEDGMVERGRPFRRTASGIAGAGHRCTGFGRWWPCG